MNWIYYGAILFSIYNEIKIENLSWSIRRKTLNINKEEPLKTWSISKLIIGIFCQKGWKFPTHKLKLCITLVLIISLLYSSSSSKDRKEDGKINHTDFTFSCSPQFCLSVVFSTWDLLVKNSEWREKFEKIFGSSKKKQKKCFRWHFSTSMRLLVIAKIKTLIYI